MRPRPLSLLVGALTAGPTAEGGRPSAGTDLEPLFTDRAARSFAPPPFWSSGYHPEALRWISSDITPVTKLAQLDFPGAATRWHPAWPIMRVASHCAQAFTGVHASEETSDFPHSLQLGAGPARTWHTGLHGDPQRPKAIPRERGGARLLSISAEANAGRVGGPSPEERRIRGDLPTAISCNG
jgi:hypothetical protein